MAVGGGPALMGLTLPAVAQVADPAVVASGASAAAAAVVTAEGAALAGTPVLAVPIQVVVAAAAPARVGPSSLSLPTGALHSKQEEMGLLPSNTCLNPSAWRRLD